MRVILDNGPPKFPFKVPYIRLKIRSKKKLRKSRIIER
jgi:hypothetical protein